MDGEVRRIGEGESQDHAGAGVGNGDADESSGAAQQQALDEHLADEARARRAQGHADGSLGAAGRTLGQQKIRNVGAGYEQNQSRDRHQQMEAAAGFLLQVLDSGAAGSQHDVLLGDLSVASVDGVGRYGGQPVAQAVGEFGLQADGIHAGFDAPENVEPVGSGCFRMLVSAFDDWVQR